MFNILFGITGYAQFTPIAPCRGLPPDISNEATEDYAGWDDVFGETWISLSEIEAIDWDVRALDRRPHEYRRDASGQLVYTGKGIVRSMPRPYTELVEGETWQDGESVYRVEKMARRDALNADWQLLFRLMRALSEESDRDHVRLVVWFNH